jgi:hypothetical protein
MDLTKLQELKRLLVEEKVLSTIWTYFLDHFGHDSAFHGLGQRGRHAFVEAVIAQVVRQLYPQAEAVTGLLLDRLAEQEFVHGGFFVEARPGGVIYDEDGRVGLIAIAELPPSIDVKYARFLGQPIRTVGPPSRN